MKIDGSSTKKYIFTNNSSNPVNIKKGEDKTVTLKASSETEFTVENGALKEVIKPTTDDKGIPTKCTSAGSTSPCELSEEDLKKIKFVGLGEGGATADTVDNFPSGQKITLKINSSPSNKYTFNNSSSTDVTLKKGSDGSAKTVVLKTGETEFTVESGALKLVEAPKKNNFGLPESCNLTSGTASCTLSVEDLKNIKFKAYGDSAEGTVTVDPTSLSTNQISLSIATSNSTKIYTFKNTSSSAVTLTKGSDKKVILDIGDTEFTDENDQLKSYEDPSFTTINSNLEKLKLPNKCKFKSADNGKTTKDCTVTVDELKKVEFENKGTGDLTVEGVTDSIKLGIKILKYDSDSAQYGSKIKDNDPLITFKNESSKITIKGSDNNNIVIPKKSNMEFLMKASSEGGEKKLSKYQKGLSSTSPAWGILCTAVGGSTTKWSCTPHSTSSNFPKFFENNLSTFKELKGVQDSKNIFEASGDTDDYNLGFKFKVLEAISGTDNSVSLTANNTYEIKYVSGKGWGYVKKD